MNLHNLHDKAAGDMASDMEVRHPATDEVLRAQDGRAVTMSVVGFDSQKVRAKRHKLGNRRLNRNNRKVTAEGREAENIELLAATIEGWDAEGLAYALSKIYGQKISASDLEFSEKTAQDLLTGVPWLRDQVDEYSGDRANFLPSASN